MKIQPVVEVRSRAKKGETKKVKDKPYGAHRVVVLLHHRYFEFPYYFSQVILISDSAEAIQRMLFLGHHASHLCHQPTCINPDHIVVEDKADNEARKVCKGKVSH